MNVPIVPVVPIVPQFKSFKPFNRYAPFNPSFIPGSSPGQALPSDAGEEKRQGLNVLNDV
jgi:hypothetical protein